MAALAVLGVSALLSPATASPGAPPGAATSETFPGEVGLWAVGASVFGQPEQIYLSQAGTGGGGIALASGSEPDWSPNGRKIAFVRRGDLYTMRADGSRVTRVTAGAHAPAWSPDGRKIAFAGTYGDLWTVRPDGTQRTRLTDPNAGDDQPAWSPDGTKIAFSSTRGGGDREIFVMASNGLGLTVLTNNTASDDAPDWSPDGTRIVFVDNGNLGVMNADGSGNTRLLTLSRTILTSPSWSPDGTRVAFIADVGFSGTSPGVVNADGSGPVITNGGGQQYFAVDWQSVPALDRVGPKIEWLTPAGNGQVYARYSRHIADYRCADPSGVLSCVARVIKPDGREKSVADGAPLPTAVVGRYTMEITAQDAAFNWQTASVTYEVRG